MRLRDRACAFACIILRDVRLRGRFLGNAVENQAYFGLLIVRPPASSIRYIAGCDASGGRNDSFTLAIAHMDADGRAIVDAVRERLPPFSPDDVVREFVAVLDSYKIATVRGDRYAGVWAAERFAMYGVRSR